MKQPMTANQRAVVIGRARLDQERAHLLQIVGEMPPSVYDSQIRLLAAAEPPKAVTGHEWDLLSRAAPYSLQDLYTEAWGRRIFGRAEDAEWREKLAEPPRQPPRCPPPVEKAVKVVCIGPVFVVVALFWLAYLAGKVLLGTRLGRAVLFLAAAAAVYALVRPWDSGGVP